MKKFNINNTFIDGHEFLQTPPEMPERWILVLPDDFKVHQIRSERELYYFNHNTTEKEFWEKYQPILDKINKIANGEI